MSKKYLKYKWIDTIADANRDTLDGDANLSLLGERFCYISSLNIPGLTQKLNQYLKLIKHNPLLFRHLSQALLVLSMTTTKS